MRIILSLHATTCCTDSEAPPAAAAVPAPVFRTCALRITTPLATRPCTRPRVVLQSRRASPRLRASFLVVAVAVCPLAAVAVASITPVAVAAMVVVAVSGPLIVLPPFAISPPISIAVSAPITPFAVAALVISPPITISITISVAILIASAIRFLLIGLAHSIRGRARPIGRGLAISVDAEMVGDHTTGNAAALRALCTATAAEPTEIVVAAAPGTAAAAPGTAAAATAAAAATEPRGGRSCPRCGEINLEGTRLEGLAVEVEHRFCDRRVAKVDEGDALLLARLSIGWQPDLGEGDG